MIITQLNATKENSATTDSVACLCRSKREKDSLKRSEIFDSTSSVTAINYFNLSLKNTFNISNDSIS